MSAYSQTVQAGHGGSLPTHEPQAQRFKSATRRVGNLQFNRAGFKLFFSNLKHWFTDTWLDWVTLIIIGVTAALVRPSPNRTTGCLLTIYQVWTAPHTFTRLFPVTFYTASGDIAYPELSYPYVEPIFSSLLAGILDAVIPIAVIVLSQIWIQSFHVMANGILGLCYALATGTCFQVILKKTIGGLRPHFLSVCEPVLPPGDGSQGVGYQNLMFTIEQVCTGDSDRIRNALESFPSGHSEIAWAGMGYLSIYLFCHLRIRNISRRRPSHWRMLFVVAPLLFATYLASTLVLGYHHHGTDVLAGGLIGILMAFFGYRMCFASIWDPKWNTVPMTRIREDHAGADEEGLQYKRDTLGNGNAYGMTEPRDFQPA